MSQCIKEKDDIEIIKLCLKEVDDFFHDRYYLFFVLGINSCFRPQELLALEWKTILDENLLIRNFVNYNQYLFSFNYSCQTALFDYMSKYNNYHFSKYVFGDSKPLSIETINRIFRMIRKDLSLDYDLSSLSLRKTFVYWQIKTCNHDYVKMSKLTQLLYPSCPNINQYCEYEINDDLRYINNVCL